MRDIGLEIRILRERLKISAKDLAERVGLSQSQISRLEKGQRRIDTGILQRIAQELDVEVSHFFGATSTLPTSVPSARPPSIGKMIRTERRRRHLSAEELASRIGNSKSVLQKIEEGKRHPEAELLQRILKALRLPSKVMLTAQHETILDLETQVTRLHQALSEVTRGDLELVDGEMNKARHQRQGVPILGALVAGYPRRFDSSGRPVAEVVDFLYIPELEHQDAFALHVVGDTMEVAGSIGKSSFREGDLVIFAKAPVRNRDFVFARLARGEPTFRQVFFEPRGRTRLQPLNLNHPSHTYERDEVVSTWRMLAHVNKY